MRIAMWSGPRNLSTAMMYAFGARNDCAVWDEPYYAAYLAATGLDHPMKEEILEQWEQDPGRVARRCLGPIPDGESVFYQKQMTHHMIPAFDRSWMKEMTNIFLIRDPARVIASYLIKRENPTLEDIGFKQQAELFEQVTEQTGTVPVVIDSVDILADPGGMLNNLCDRIGLDYQASMLSWPKGGHKDDGPWAPHWYQSAWASTGFGKAAENVTQTPDDSVALLELAQPFYDMMAKHKL